MAEDAGIEEEVADAIPVSGQWAEGYASGQAQAHEREIEALQGHILSLREQSAQWQRFAEGLVQALTQLKALDLQRDVPAPASPVEARRGIPARARPSDKEV